MNKKSIARALLILIFSMVSLNGYAIDRIALVIGNADYQNSPLKNSVNDAEDIALSIKGLGFKVTLIKNASQEEMEESIAEFGKALSSNTVGLFYYSGHAVQYNGSNYLIPIGAMDKVKKASHLKYKTVQSSLILDEFEQSNSKLNFLFLDACRNSPFRGFNRGIESGLLKSNSAEGTLVAYSTAPGRVASDGNGRNSPYTKHLMKFIKQPNVQIELILKNVNASVTKETQGMQSPWYESSISGNFCFNVVNDGCGIYEEKIKVYKDEIEEKNIRIKYLENSLKSQKTVRDLVAQVREENRRAKKIYTSARSLLVTDQYEQAIALFKQYLDIYPDNNYAPDATYWLAKTYLASKKYHNAKVIFRVFQKEHPLHHKYSNSLFDLAMSLYALKENKEAELMLRTLVKKFPRHARVMQAKELIKDNREPKTDKNYLAEIIEEDRLYDLKINYINDIANKVKSNWRYIYKVKGGCDVHILQDRSGKVQSVNLYMCDIDKPERIKAFKNAIERSVYKTSPLPLPPVSSVFDREIRFRFIQD
jgi:tol-pal system protein YbgF